MTDQTPTASLFDDVDSVVSSLQAHHYLADRGLAVSIFLSLRLQKPLFLEGEAGVGKTEVAKVLARILDAPLIRLQCHEGLDVASALYEWDYPRQMLHLRLMETGGHAESQVESSLYQRRFLQARPLLEALEAGAEDRPAVLLIDELDRSDEEFEAFLLEVLSDFQVSIPELGVVRAQRRPVVVLTSNRTREVHDALKRRCLYRWIDYPDFRRELEIVRLKAPQAEEALARHVVAFVQELRRMELFKPPGVAETLDWTAALIALDRRELEPEVVQETLGVVLKYQDDIQALPGATLRDVLDRTRVQSRLSPSS